jgi:hypothetical protein
MAEPVAAHNDDKSGVPLAFRSATADSRSHRRRIQAKELRHPPWPDHDPSRVAIEHGTGGFARHAWRDPAESPDSVAGLPFVGRGGPLARRFRRSRSGLYHSPDRQEPESGSGHTETFCTKLHRHMRQCMSDALKAHAPPLSGLAKLSAPPHELLLDRILAKAPQPLNLLRAWRARTCGYVDNASPHTHRRSSKSKPQHFIEEGTGPSVPSGATVERHKGIAPFMRGSWQPFTA